MKFLVTGGHGLIGHNVVQRLQQQGHEIVIIDIETNYGIIDPAELTYLLEERKKKILPCEHYNMDIQDKLSLAWLFERHRFDCVIHLASFPRQKVVNADPAWASKTMSEGLINLLELATQNQVQRFLYISSSMVYGDFSDDVTEDAPCRPQGQYGIMKLAGEWLTKDYARRKNMEYVIIRPSAVYGPLDVEDRVVAKFMLTAMRGGTLKVNGAGETLDFTYVDDAADGIVAASTLPQAANKTFNITKSHSVSLLSAAQMIVDMVGRGSIECRDRDLDFPSRGALNIDQAKKHLGFNPLVDVEQGFAAYHAWLSTSKYWYDKF